MGGAGVMKLFLELRSEAMLARKLCLGEESPDKVALLLRVNIMALLGS
jgi:hypothetical protein